MLPFARLDDPQTNVSSSFSAEVIACAENDDRGFDLKESLNDLFTKAHFKQELLTESQALFDTLNTLNDKRQYRLRNTLPRIRKAFEAREIQVLRWAYGTQNYADALTKRNHQL